MKKIMIVEDDQKLREELKILLEGQGYTAIIEEQFDHILEDMKNESIDMILLDINLPGQNGIRLLKEIRKVTSLPILMVTSQNTEVDEVMSMSYGADDYITKPYHPTILLLRIEAIFKRLTQSSNHYFYQGLEIVPEKSLFCYQEKEYPLSKNEMQIFCYFLKHVGKIVSRSDIMNYLWDTDHFIDDNTLTVNISRLRNRLKEVGLDDVIETRKGQGYLLK